MKLLAALGSAFLLASTLNATAATVTVVFEDDFLEDSFDVSTGTLTNWNGVGTASTCGEAIVTCLESSNFSLTSLLEFTLEAGATYNLTAYFKPGLYAAAFTLGIGAASGGGTTSVLNTSSFSTGDFTPVSEVIGSIVLNLESYDNDLNQQVFLSSFLDRVVLSKSVPEETFGAIPLPATAPMLLAGLAVIPLLRRRKRR